MDLLQKIEMYIGEDYYNTDTRYGGSAKDAKIAKMVKQHNISVKYGKKGTLTRPPEGYVKDNKGMYHKVSDDEWKKKRLGEGKSDTVDFPAKKKKDDADSEESAEDAGKDMKDGDTGDEGEDPYDPETDLDKEKKQKELKKKARNTSYVPPYSAS